MYFSLEFEVKFMLSDWQQMCLRRCGWVFCTGCFYRNPLSEDATMWSSKSLVSFSSIVLFVGMWQVLCSNNRTMLVGKYWAVHGTIFIRCIENTHQRKTDKECLHLCFPRYCWRLCAYMRRWWQTCTVALHLSSFRGQISAGSKERQTSDKTDSEVKGISMPLVYFAFVVFFCHSTWILILWKAKTAAKCVF